MCAGNIEFYTSSTASNTITDTQNGRDNGNMGIGCVPGAE
jgi:hypothetical protein